jgi:hypothetical protein
MAKALHVLTTQPQHGDTLNEKIDVPAPPVVREAKT